ncbi:hypothetical protein HYC85_028167 [Camellia sinensis]|uniref:DUF4218 domain-containing protein n=1 Tax=Camellia sinensis TaxID=4442 RepID=A0A7J7FYC7_CAMSI|nr:hypothetical protein HYC85_028167 [Camellia sinensis]
MGYTNHRCYLAEDHPEKRKSRAYNGNFFQDLCSKTLRRSKLEKLEKRIIHILCKLEKIFPPAFFDLMIHLAVLLPREAILGGPVQYRWMYPIEMIETVHNRPERNEDSGECQQGLIAFTKLHIESGRVIRGSLDEIMEENRDNEGDKEHNIPDVDMDPDMNYDIAVQPKCANAREKEIRVAVDDDVEYKPLESEDDNDDESLGFFDREKQEMPPGLRLQSHSRPLTHTPKKGMDPLSQEVGTQPLPPHNVQPKHEVTASSSVVSHDRRGCGPTCGIQTHHIVDKDGKMLVPIPEQFRAPVGDNASKLVSMIGIEVQTQLLDLSIRRWKMVNVVDKEPIIQRLAALDQFDLQGNQSDVTKALNTQFGRRLSGFTYKLHKQYKQLKDARGDDYIRSHPPARVTLNQWTSLIDKWNSQKFKGRKTNNCLIYFKLIGQHDTDTSRTPLVDWCDPLDPRGVVSQGYVKGLGMRPSSSMNRIVAPARNSDYVQRLEMQIAQQNEQIARFEKSK